MDSATTYDQVFRATLAGHPAAEVLPCLAQLTSDDRQAVLCTVCSIRGEIADNSREHGDEIEKLLSKGCRFFVNGRASCFDSKE